MSQPWPEVPIKETYLGLFDGPHATPPVSDEGPVFLGIGNVTEDGHLDLSDVRHINEADFPKWTKRVTPQPGDIVFTYEATLNRYAIVPEGFRGCLGRRMALIRPNPAKVDTRFLHYTFFSPEWRATIEANRLAGATVDRIPLTRFPDFPVRLPPLPTQRKIAAILSAYDDLIENNTRRVRVLEQMARALYREWFVEYRFPGHEQAQWVEDEAGRRPEGWERGVFGDIAAVTTRSVNPAKHPEEEFEHFSLPAFDAGQLPSVECGESIKSNKHLIPKDCVLLPKLNPRIPRVWLPPAPQGKRQISSTEFLPLLPLNGYSKYWLFSFCANPDFMEELTSMASGTSTSHQRISPKGLATFPVVVPPKELIQRFSELMGPNLELAMSLRQRNANLRQTRDLLLPRLVSGELDVSGLRVAGVEEEVEGETI